MKNYIALIILSFLLSCNSQTGTSPAIDKVVPVSDSVKTTLPVSSISIIAIKGNQIKNASTIFNAFKYIDLHKDRQFDTLESCISFLNEHYLSYTEKEISLRGFWVANKWTIFWDPEMIDITENQALEGLSKNLHSEVLTFLVQRSSSTIGFAKYYPEKQRKFFMVDGHIIENSGMPVAEEKGLNFNQHISMDDILKIAAQFQVDVLGKNNAVKYTAKELGYNSELKNEDKE